MLIAIEGIDGSGKGTQAKLLHERCREAGLSSALISFPRYAETRFGRAVGEFLNGRFGTLDQVSPFLAALLYAGDRFESRALLRGAIADNDVVILDRYVASNVAHQGSKLAGDDRRDVIRWIGEVEHGVYELPRPDLVILLDLPVETARTLVARKQARAYTDRKADIQEADARYLAGVRDVYRELAAHNPAWRVVECLRGDTLRPVDDIAEEIWSLAQAACLPSPPLGTGGLGGSR